MRAGTWATSAVLGSPRLVTRLVRVGIAESTWEVVRHASPDFVIQLRCLAGGLDLRGEGPEGGGPDRCLRRPVLGKASDRRPQWYYSGI